jgi:methyl-accepting chemotaxis protein
MFGKSKALQTQLNATQTELQTLNDLFKSLNNNMAMIEFNLDGTIISANDIFKKVVGYSANELKGKAHSSLCDSRYTSSPAFGTSL